MRGIPEFIERYQEYGCPVGQGRFYPDPLEDQLENLELVQGGRVPLGGVYRFPYPGCHSTCALRATAYLRELDEGDWDIDELITEDPVSPVTGVAYHGCCYLDLIEAKGYLIEVVGDGTHVCYTVYDGETPLFHSDLLDCCPEEIESRREEIIGEVERAHGDRGRAESG